MDMFSTIEDMTPKEFREFLNEEGYHNEYDMLALMNYTLIKCVKVLLSQDLQRLKEIKEFHFAHKYDLKREEIETIKLMAKGYKYREIADAQGFTISFDGVKKRVKRIFAKLDVHSKQEAVEKAKDEGLII